MCQPESMQTVATMIEKILHRVDYKILEIEVDKIKKEQSIELALSEALTMIRLEFELMNDPGEPAPFNWIDEEEEREPVPNERDKLATQSVGSVN